MSQVNDIDITRWKEYLPDIITDSLWLFARRDSTGAHASRIWGNFIPQVPQQLLRRYTKRGDWVLDPFVGKGTTLIECRRLGRNGLGIELNPETALQAVAQIKHEANPFGVSTDIVVGNSVCLDFAEVLRQRGPESVQLLILHPPYHDIIRFSQSDDHDLSSAPSLREFFDLFAEVVERTYSVLDPGRYMGLVIGDKYANGRWVPLGFYAMATTLNQGYVLKGINVKNVGETRGKRGSRGLWRWRALRYGFYLFAHEYVMIFQKPKRPQVCPFTFALS